MRPATLIVPVAVSWAEAVWLAAIATVPPEPLKSRPPIALVKVPVVRRPGPAALPIVTIEFDGMALEIPRASVPLSWMNVGPT